MQDVKLKKGMSFAEACAEAAQIPEFVENFNRLTGNNFRFCPPKNGLEAAIHNATGFQGFDEKEAEKFMRFFHEYVWARLPDEAFFKKENE